MYNLSSRMSYALERNNKYIPYLVRYTSQGKEYLLPHEDAQKIKGNNKCDGINNKALYKC